MFLEGRVFTQWLPTQTIPPWGGGSQQAMPGFFREFDGIEAHGYQLAARVHAGETRRG